MHRVSIRSLRPVNSGRHYISPKRSSTRIEVRTSTVSCYNRSPPSLGGRLGAMSCAVNEWREGSHLVRFSLVCVCVRANNSQGVSDHSTYLSSRTFPPTLHSLVQQPDSYLMPIPGIDALRLRACSTRFVGRHIIVHIRIHIHIHNAHHSQRVESRHQDLRIEPNSKPLLDYELRCQPTLT